ncbi:alpha/beta fold hydrolase [Paludisphaera mucosa]|uniref:Alpha/beta fold hydrolase n=1 Tax=Paludisphaera mucosa TaxID=3030827 RepID=A0ABT6FIT0_9BACT|nr:alpha/beta fold hydrolase [Paludisphaera mucosa]MDG3007485.1 alpha/beta fold hydrolase [Paludisphaera mucosa]
MARIVLVHGIDNQRETEDGIRAAWIPALAGGVRLAGRGDLADRLQFPTNDPARIDVRVAYYGHLFRAPDVQGARDDLDDLTADQAALAAALLTEWLERVAERAPDESASAVQASRALDLVRDPEAVGAQGVGNATRTILRTLARLPLVARPGMAFVERFLITTLKQVTRYLTEEDLRDQVRQIVLDRLDVDTAVLIGHSLGSVVAYECAHRLPRPLPLLVTLGSPLGLRTIVADRLDPPPSFPRAVQTWLNHANLEDVVAADPDLHPLSGRSVPEGSRLVCSRYQEPGGNPHDPRTYLGRKAVGRATVGALT